MIALTGLYFNTILLLHYSYDLTGSPPDLYIDLSFACQVRIALTSFFLHVKVRKDRLGG